MIDHTTSEPATRDLTRRRRGGVLLIAAGTALTAVKIALGWTAIGPALAGLGPQRGLVLAVLAAGVVALALGLVALAVELAGGSGLVPGAVATALLLVMITLTLFSSAGLDLPGGAFAMMMMAYGTNKLSTP